MNNRNSDSKTAYLLESAYWLLLFMFIYRGALFIPLHGHSLESSKLILWILVIVFTAIGIACTFKRRRNGMNILAVSLPFGLYALVSYYRIIPTAVIIISAATLVISLVYFAAVLKQKESCSTGNKLSLSKRIWHGLLGCRVLISVCLLFVMAVAIFCKEIDSDLLTVTTNGEADISEPAESEWTVYNKIELLTSFEEDKWRQLNAQERLELLAIVVNIEADKFGIDGPLTLKSEILTESTIAEYRYTDHCIAVDLLHLAEMEASKAIEVVCHECCHAYQRQMAEIYSSVPDGCKRMPMLEKAKEYAYEFNNYIDGNNDYKGYISQQCEIDANKYGVNEAEYYRTVINGYLRSPDFS